MRYVFCRLTLRRVAQGLMGFHERRIVMSPIGNGLSGDLIILDYVRLSRDMIHRICCGVITVWAVRDGFRRRMGRFVECAERTK
jgi:hypothetical protein